MTQGRTPLFRILIKHLHSARHANGAWTRREFVASTVAMLAGGALSSCHSLKSDAHRNFKGPVVIIGAGIAGLTAAYTLMKAGVECELYEGSQRFGGRMFTKRNFNSEGMFCELGGELVDSNHKPLIDLCHELGLEMQSLNQGEKGVDFYHIDGRIHTDADVIPAFQSLAQRMAADTEGLTDEKGEFTAKARTLDRVSLRTYLADAGSSTPAWLIKMLDVAYTCEQGLDLSRQSALNLLNSISSDTKEGFALFGASDEAWRVRGGNDSLPTQVYQQIAGKVKTHPGHTLCAIAPRGDSMVLTFRCGGQVVKREAAHVICAIPFSVLRGIEGVKSLPLSAAKKRAIAEMGYGTGMKVMWGVKDRVWRRPAEGRSFSAMAPYCPDQPFQQVWETSRGQKGASGIITNYMGGPPAAHWNESRLKAFPQEIQKVFPALAGEWDGNRAIMNWPQMKWVKGSYSAPLRGQHTWVYKAAASPELNGSLHFAGEHTSLQSWGWMNGGVETGMRAAKEMMQA